MQDEFFSIENHLSNVLPDVISKNKKTIHLSHENIWEAIKSIPAKITYNGKKCWINSSELKKLQLEQVSISSITKIDYFLKEGDKHYNMYLTVYY